MPSGSNVPNPSELLMQADFQQLINEGLALCDRIVFDTAPILPVSDTLLLASKVQTVVLMVQACKTSRKAVAHSVQLLNKANAPLGGIVLNLLPTAGSAAIITPIITVMGTGIMAMAKRKRKRLLWMPD